MSKTVVLIPARGGSKGVTQKNSKLLGGIPLVTHSLAAAKDVLNTEHIFVSSDDDSILSIAKSFGAKTIKRPVELASDSAPMDPVIVDFIHQANLNTEDTIVLLQPTSPFRSAQHIAEALNLFHKNPECKMLMSVCNMDNIFLKAYVGGSKYLTPVMHEDTPFSRRQDLPSTYMPNGAIYIFRVGDFQLQNKIPRTHILPYLMSDEDSLDIDTESDFIAAEQQLQIRKQYVK